MELLVTLRNPKMLYKIQPYVQGIIVGSLFSLSYNYTLNEIANINNYCKNKKIKIYITIDAFISEDDKANLYSYMEFIKDLNVDGIYFHDLAIYEVAGMYEIRDKLIYDGYSVMCNTLEATYFLSRGVDGVVISRELTFEEVNDIITMIPGMIDMQIFGYLRMSYSRRKFIRNYMKEIGKPYIYEESKNLSLIEEKRNYKMPIVEDQYGTRIYTDFILESMKEIPYLRNNLRRGIIDTLFIDDENLILTILREYQRVTVENSEFLRQSIYKNFPNRYSSGYFYQKTNITKDE